MKAFIRKLRARAGDTLLETLVAVLIIALSSGFLVTSAMTAAKFNSTAGQRAADRSRAMDVAENQVTPLAEAVEVVFSFPVDPVRTDDDYVKSVTGVRAYGEDGSAFRTYRGN